MRPELDRLKIPRTHPKKTDYAGCAGLIIIFLVLSLFLIFPYFEARHFNRCTGGSATYFDALFTTLRVTECSVIEPKGFDR